MPDVVHPDTLDVIARLADTEAKLSLFREALEFLIERRADLKCKCNTVEFHEDSCPIGNAINTLAEH